MASTDRFPKRILFTGALVVAAIAATLVAVPAGGAVPKKSVVGKVQYVDVRGTTDVTTKIRSFTAGATVSGLGNGGGGGAGKANFGDPTVVQDVIAESPLLMEVLASGKHLKQIVVTLYQPDSTKKSQVWTYDSAVLSFDAQVQKGPASATPRETVAWAFDRVTQTTYKSNGSTVAAKACFDLVGNKAC